MLEYRETDRSEGRTFDRRWSISFFLYLGVRSAILVFSSQIWLCASAVDGKTVEEGESVVLVSRSAFTFFGGKLRR